MNLVKVLARMFCSVTGMQSASASVFVGGIRSHVQIDSVFVCPAENCMFFGLINRVGTNPWRGLT